MGKTVTRLKNELRYLQYDVVKWAAVRLLKPQQAALLNANKELKNSHSGERCFILGNGPSIRDVDFSRLRDEFVFTVNQAARYENFAELKTNVHMWADQTFFKDSDGEEDPELLAAMRNVRTADNSPLVFVPLNQQKFMETRGLAELLNVRYFRSDTAFFEGFRHTVAYTRPVPAFGTVVQWCITLAVYMGFQEIYLLGCDNTSLMANFRAAMQQPADADYGYAISAGEKKRMETAIQEKKLEDYVAVFLENMRDYRYLKAYCDRMGIKLINCSSQTVLDSIPRMRLDEVLPG